MKRVLPFCTGEVRKMLNVPEHRLATLIRSGHLDVPLEGRRRRWSKDLVKRAADLLGVPAPTGINII